jgi:flagellar basal-body rod protein FlgG
MLVQRKKMDVITNNITNIETAGFKKDQLLSRSFKDMMIKRINDPNVLYVKKGVGPLNNGIHIDEVVTDFVQGNLEGTQRLTDLALQGSGFFVVSTPNGQRYTRDGSFTVNSQGYLTNNDGHYLMGTNGRVHVGEGKFSVDDQGNVTVDGSVVNKIRVVDFNDPNGLRKEGNNLYYNFSGQNVLTPKETVVKQGFIENSNADISREMVDMMEVSRTYETNQRMIKMLDESLGKTVNEVGRV